MGFALDAQMAPSESARQQKLLQLRIGGHREKTALNVTQLEEHEVILGQSWLRHHNPTTNWQDGRAVLKKGDQEVTLHPIPDPEVANLVSGRGASVF